MKQNFKFSAQLFETNMLLTFEYKPLIMNFTSQKVEKTHFK